MIEMPAAQALIRAAFRSVPYPGDLMLRNSAEGTEPFQVEAEFRGKTDWAALSSGFLDRSPGGLASALSFFSVAAFRFYIPAHMLADLDGELQRTDPMFHLTYGLDQASRGEYVNPRRYGTMTWFDYAQVRFKDFDQLQRQAVAAYLDCKKSSGQLLEEEVATIDEALATFWLRNAA